MKSISADKIRYWILWAWLCAESGNFISSQGEWTNSHLFWPFWITLFLSITLIIELIDRQESQ